jgi:hypothetical protein
MEFGGIARYGKKPSIQELSRTIAVGMPVARHPPHRSQRAELPHWAPTSGNDAQATNCLPYPFQRTLQVYSGSVSGAWFAGPLCPEPGLLDWIPLGQSPSLHSLRRPQRTTTLVRELPGYYETV